MRYLILTRQLLLSAARWGENLPLPKVLKRAVKIITQNYIGGKSPK
jgi:hypothetical protein